MGSLEQEELQLLASLGRCWLLGGEEVNAFGLSHFGFCSLGR